MIVDAHQHVFWHGRDDHALVTDCEEHGIDRCWLLTWEIPHAFGSMDIRAYPGALNPARTRPDGSHPGVSLEDLILARDRHPDRFVLGYCPDPANPDAPEMFEAAVSMHGVRVCGEWKYRMLIDDPRCLELFRAAGRAGAPVVLHLDVPYLPDGEGTLRYQPLWYGGTIENLERALRACPETVFIGHAPGFWREISGDADSDPSMYPSGPIVSPGRLRASFDSHPNLCADISAGSGLRALQRDPAHATELVERYSDRLLFGRDYYGGEHQSFLATLDLSADTRAKLMGGNADRLIGSSVRNPRRTLSLGRGGTR